MRYNLGLCLLCIFYIVSDAITHPSLAKATTSSDEELTPGDKQYEQLISNIYIGKASIYELRQALSRDEPYDLTNIVHTLFAMRWHRGVQHLLRRMWMQDKSKEPELAWESIAAPPVRIALASTINRIQIADTNEQLAYIRNYKYDKNNFNRAQAVIALGLNGDPADIDYLQSMGDGNNHYVAQTAITSLALMVDNRARDAMIELFHKYKGSKRSDLLAKLLKLSYYWSEDEDESSDEN